MGLIQLHFHVGASRLGAPCVAHASILRSSLTKIEEHWCKKKKLSTSILFKRIIIKQKRIDSQDLTERRWQIDCLVDETFVRETFCARKSIDLS